MELVLAPAVHRLLSQKEDLVIVSLVLPFDLLA